MSTLLEVHDLRVQFGLHGTFRQRLSGRASGVVKAVDGVSFDLREGEVLGLVGESGSGKTTLGRALLGLVRPSGSVRLRGMELAGLPERRLRPLRRRLQMVFQDPHASLNPAMSLQSALAHPLRIHRLTRSKEDTRARVREALELVGLTPVEQFLSKRPAELSGGQKQRAVIARAVIAGPELIVADEPVSMLDMSVRAKILELLLDLRLTLGLTYVYITHDLATAKLVCDRVAIMYLGRIVEIGPAEEIFATPRHPYTQALVRAIPTPRGEIPDAARPPRGCAFHPRCPKAFADCGWEGRDLRQLLEQRWAREGEAVYEAERPLVGDVDGDGFVPTPDPPALIELLRRVRAERPGEPLWRGVQEVAEANGGVRVRFAAGADPALRQAGGARVACHLYATTVSRRTPTFRHLPEDYA